MLRRLKPTDKLLMTLPFLLGPVPVSAQAVTPNHQAPAATAFRTRTLTAEPEPDPAQSTGEAADVREGDGGGPALERALMLMQAVRASSYPELAGADIRLRPFRSERDFFRTQFKALDFLTGRRMRFVIYVNPRVFEMDAPDEALRAVMAHELAHVLSFSRGKRVRLLGLVRLVSKGFAARFERRTDLVAISRGYGAGLGVYRRWLYRHVTPKRLPEKRRNYFSPEEIDALLAIAGRRPEALRYWLKHVPRNFREIMEYDARAAG